MVRLQRATARLRAAYAAKMPTAAPRPAQTPITKTGCTPSTWAVRAGCMVSGTTTAAPSAAATAATSSGAGAVAALGTSAQQPARPARRPPRPAIAIQATQASWATH